MEEPSLHVRDARFADHAKEVLTAHQPWLARMRGWLAQTFAGLTWPRLGIFCLVLIVIAMDETPPFRALMADGAWSDKMMAIVKAWVYVLLQFTPVLLLVVAVENRGPRGGRARVLALALAIVAGQTLGTILFAIGLSVLYPEGYMAAWSGSVSGPAPSRNTLLFFAGYGMGGLGCSAVATTFWFFMKRDIDMRAALQRERQDREETDRESVEALHSS